MSLPLGGVAIALIASMSILFMGIAVQGRWKTDFAPISSIPGRRVGDDADIVGHGFPFKNGLPGAQL